MPFAFTFYARSSDVDPADSGRQGEFVVMAANDQIDRMGYARPSYEAMIIGRRRRPHSNLHFEARILRRGRGERPTVPRSGILLVTLCSLRREQKESFLRQYERALAFIEGKSGFNASLLFGEEYAGETSRFVNVAQWADLNSFRAVFSHPTFQTIVSSSFRPASEVMLANYPIRASKGE